MNSTYHFLRLVTQPAYRIQGIGLGRVCELIRRAVARNAPLTPLVIKDFRGSARFNCYLRDHMGSQIFFRGSYSGDQLLLLEQILETSSVFVDVGANQGEFTIAAANIIRHGEIIAIEPVEQFRERLAENIRINGLSNVRVEPIALGDEEGFLPIFDSESAFPDGTMHDGLSTLFASASRNRCRGMVPVKTLDAVLAELGVTRVDVIKLDIEGAEWMALRGAARTLSKYRPILILEIGRETCRAAGYEPEDFAAWLLSLNYQLERVVDGGRAEPIAVGSLTDFQNIVARPA